VTHAAPVKLSEDVGAHLTFAELQDLNAAQAFLALPSRNATIRYLLNAALDALDTEIDRAARNTVEAANDNEKGGA